MGGLLLRTRFRQRDVASFVGASPWSRSCRGVADCSRAEEVITLSTGWVVVQACCSVPSVCLGRVGGLLRVRLAIPGRACTRIIDTSRSRVCVLEEIAQISRWGCQMWISPVSTCQFYISYARSLFPALAFPLSLPTVIDTLNAPPHVCRQRRSERLVPSSVRLRTCPGALL